MTNQGELLPALDLTELPPLEIPGHFVSQHANVADYAIHSASSKHSRRTYESRLRAVANILGYHDLRAVPCENLRYEHVWGGSGPNRQFSALGVCAVETAICDNSASAI